MLHQINNLERIKKMKTKKLKRAATSQAEVNPTENVKAEVKTSKTRTPNAPKEETLDNANAANTAKKITDKKDLKYVYPKDQDTLEKRKKFRAKVRAEINKIEKLLAKLKNSELPEDMELYNAEYSKLEKVRSRYYTKEYLATL